MTNNSDMSVVFLSLLHNLQLTQQAALVNSMLFLNIFKILKMSFWHFEGKIAYILPFGLFFFIKSCKAFRIAQSKWPQLVKPCFDSDLYFTFKTSGRANCFLQSPSHSISGKQGNPPPSPSRHINNSLNVYFFLNSELKNV